MVVMIIIGLFFIGIGFIVKYQPDLIAGYHTMSHEKKKNVDIAGLSAFMTSNNPPFLIVTKNNGERIIINSREKNRTENIYAQLKEKFDQ